MQTNTQAYETHITYTTTTLLGIQGLEDVALVQIEGKRNIRNNIRNPKSV